MKDINAILLTESDISDSHTWNEAEDVNRDCFKSGIREKIHISDIAIFVHHTGTIVIKNRFGSEGVVKRITLF